MRFMVIVKASKESEAGALPKHDRRHFIVSCEHLTGLGGVGRAMVNGVKDDDEWPARGLSNPQCVL